MVCRRIKEERVRNGDVRCSRGLDVRLAIGDVSEKSGKRSVRGVRSWREM